MEWQQIISTILIPVLSVLGAGGIISAIIKRRWDKQDRKEQENKDQQSQQRKTEIRNVLREEISCVEDKIQDLHTIMQGHGKRIDELLDADVQQKAGIQAVLRDRLYQLNRYCMKKGFTTQDERDNFENMYDNYHKLFINGTMTVVREKFLQLPFEEEYNQRKQEKQGADAKSTK